MNNIIVVEGKNKYNFSNKEEMIEQFLGKDFLELSTDDKHKKLRLKTLMNSASKGIPLKDIIQGDAVEDLTKKQYIVFDEETFLLSLAKNNDIVIYEKEKADIFTKDIDKDKLKRIGKDYIRVNDCLNTILQNKIQNLYLKNKVKEENVEEERI